jgi:hypothetical protein
MKKKTWDEKFKEWRDRSGYGARHGLRRAYETGRRHQRQVCNETIKDLNAKNAELRAAVSIIAKQASEAIVAEGEAVSQRNRYRSENISLKLELRSGENQRAVLIDHAKALEDALARPWWKFWK